MEAGRSAGRALLPAIRRCRRLIGFLAFTAEELLGNAVVNMIPGQNFVETPAAVRVKFRNNAACVERLTPTGQ